MHDRPGRGCSSAHHRPQLEDRRAALSDFRDLSAAEPLRLIEKGGMSVIISMLRTDDTQLARDGLETLANLMDAEVPKGMAEAAQVAAVHNCGVFLTNSANVSTVLNTVDNEEDDMYVRYHAVQLMMRLLAVAPAQTQDAVLSQPVVVGRVMQLIEDKREIVRNEVLLLLAQLAKGNADLQNILAFQGAYDGLLAIAEAEQAEGAAGGAAVVHDCFRIMSSLLSHNASNRRFFRERQPAAAAATAAAAAVAKAGGCHANARLMWQLLAGSGGAPDADAAERRRRCSGWACCRASSGCSPTPPPPPTRRCGCRRSTPASWCAATRAA